jgi:hypothetical protein
LSKKYFEFTMSDYSKESLQRRINDSNFEQVSEIKETDQRVRSNYTGKFYVKMRGEKK